jgi:copper oxidase (laccase) domain-containing protein
VDSNGFHGEVHWRVSERQHGDFCPDRVPAQVLRSRQKQLVDAPWTLAQQVHGVGSAEVFKPGSANRSRCDILATSRRGAVLGIWVGDCVPLLLVAPSGRFVMAHVGWRGLMAGVINHAMELLMSDRPRSGPGTDGPGTDGPGIDGHDDYEVAYRVKDVVAVIGPHIGPCCYEFSPNDARMVADALTLEMSDICPPHERFASVLDMGAAVSGCLKLVGLSDMRWAPGPESVCTGCDERWFSHRVRKESERHVMAAWRQE